jgi:hypothetical protein
VTYLRRPSGKDGFKVFGLTIYLGFFFLLLVWKKIPQFFSIVRRAGGALEFRALAAPASAMAPARRRGASSKAKDKSQLSLGDLVLAKVKGFPAWPAKVCVFFLPRFLHI